MAAKNDKMGKVLPFPTLPRKPSKEPLEGGDAARVLDKEACISVLDGFARVPNSLRKLLEVPERLFLVGEASISSDPKKDISALAVALVSGKELDPKMLEDAPEYAIRMTYRSSTTYCVLLDKRRKILVMEGMGNPLGGTEPTWSHMASAVADALKERDARAGRGEKFSLIFSQEMLTRAI